MQTSNKATILKSNRQTTITTERDLPKQKPQKIYRQKKTKAHRRDRRIVCLLEASIWMVKMQINLHGALLKELKRDS